MHSLNTVYNYIYMKYISITVSIILHNRKKDCKYKQCYNDSWNTWCHVYALYMHSNIQYVNLNTSMPIKEFTPMMYIFGEDGEYVMAKRRHRLFFSLLY